MSLDCVQRSVDRNFGSAIGVDIMWELDPLYAPRVDRISSWVYGCVTLSPLRFFILVYKGSQIVSKVYVPD